MITIVDYGVGNTGALRNMFDYLGIDAEISNSINSIENSTKLVLPGVGSFDKAMTTLHNSGLVEPLNTAVLLRSVPVLGVCLGMQLMARRSEEGIEMGLGWIEADVIRITPSINTGLKGPNIGWRHAKKTGISGLLDNVQADARYYFNHSYQIVCDNPHDVLATIDYGSPLTCAVAKGHITGVQFHPEKSHRYGMSVLAAFAALEQV
jgi:glutamine amidotransferase